MDFSRGLGNQSHPRILRGEQAVITVDDGRLLIKYDDRHEFIEDQSIIAVTDKTLSTGSHNERDHARSILVVKADDTSTSACRFEAIEATGLPTSLEEHHFCDSLPPHLQSSALADQKNIHVVISSRSGTGLAEAFFEDVVRPFLSALELDNKYEVYRTTSEKTVSELAEAIFLPQARLGITQTIVVLAGDGAIVDLVNVFHSYRMNDKDKESFVNPTIALIPMGTGNAMANSAGINSDATHGLRHLLRGSPQEIPCFKSTFSPGAELLVDEGRKAEQLPIDGASGNGFVYGAVVCSWGLHASLVADSDTTEYRKHGSKRFTMAANALLSPPDGSPPHAYQGTVAPINDILNRRNDSVPLIRQEHMYVLATMVSKLEQKLTISPFSRPLDGQMRLLYFGPMSGERVMSIMGKHIHTTAFPCGMVLDCLS